MLQARAGPPPALAMHYSLVSEGLSSAKDCQPFFQFHFSFTTHYAGGEPRIRLGNLPCLSALQAVPARSARTLVLASLQLFGLGHRHSTEMSTHDEAFYRRAVRCLGILIFFFVSLFNLKIQVAGLWLLRCVRRLPGCSGPAVLSKC